VTPDVSIVIPLRDEERYVLPLHEEISAALT
jgi:glycosyltransferase involved in cell wall biosynthesis